MLIIVFLLVLIYLIWIPITVYINTITNQYYIHFKGLAKASLEADQDEVLKIKLELFFFSFHFYPLRKNLKSKKKDSVKKNKLKKKKTRFKLATILRVLKSFKVKKFLLNIDTGDCICNAKLYPLFALLNYTVGGFKINYDGRNEMVICIQNRPLRIIKAIINR